MPLPKYKTIKQDNWYHIVAVKDDSYYDKGIPVDTSRFAYRDMYYKVVCFWHLKNAKNEIIFTVQATHLVYLCEGKFRSNVYIFTSHDTDYQTLYKGIEGEKNENYDSCVLLSPRIKMNLDNNFKGIKTGRYMWENRTKAISQFATDYIQYSKYNRLQCCISAFCACYSILALPDCRSIITLSELCSIYKKDILTFNLFEVLFRNDEKTNEAKIDSFYNKINEFPSWHKKVKLNLKQIDMLHNIIVNEVFKGKSKEITSKRICSNHSDIYELIFKIALLCTFIDKDLNTLRESSMYEVAEFFYTCKKQQQLQERMEELKIVNDIIVGQWYTDSFNEFISDKVHYKASSNVGNTDVPDLVYDDIELYISLLKNIKERTSDYNELILFSELTYGIDEYLPGNSSGLFNRSMIYYSGAKNKKSSISIKEIKEEKCAFCSEKSGLSHNIFKLLGIDSSLIVGKKDNESHAYNIIYPRGYNSEPAVLYDPSFSLSFTNAENRKVSMGYFKVLSAEEFEKLKSYLEELKVNVNSKNSALESVPSILPIDSRYAVISIPYQKDSLISKGIGFETIAGTVIRSAATGTVNNIYYDNNKGFTIVIYHKFGIITTYRGLATSFVSEDKDLKKGEIIGNAKTGVFEYELKLASENVNPLIFTSLN